jgi:hypothetical protein
MVSTDAKGTPIAVNDIIAYPIGGTGAVSRGRLNTQIAFGKVLNVNNKVCVLKQNNRIAYLIRHDRAIVIHPKHYGANLKRLAKTKIVDGLLVVPPEPKQGCPDEIPF